MNRDEMIELAGEIADLLLARGVRPAEEPDVFMMSGLLFQRSLKDREAGSPGRSLSS